MNRSALALLLLTCSSVTTQAATLFVKPTGSDQAAGTSWETALRTPQAAALRAGPGDVVVIRRANTPYRVLEMVRSGAPGAPITFRGESASAPPVFSGAVAVSKWQKSSVAGVWHAPLDRTIFVIENGEPVPAASSAACLDGRWFWSDNRVYFRNNSSLKPSAGIRAASPGGIVIGPHSWIVVTAIDCALSNSACVSVKGGSNNVIRDVTAVWSWRGVHLTAGAQNNVVEDCVASANREGIYLSFGASYNTVRRCQVLSNGNQRFWRDGDRAGLAIGERGPNVGNSILQNEIAYNGGPDSDAGLIAYEAPYTIFENNVIHENFGSGVFVTQDSYGSTVRSNEITANGFAAVSGGYAGITALTVRNGSHSTLAAENVLIGNHVSPNSPWVGKGIGPRGAIDVRALPDQVMHDIRFLNNVVMGTQGGPDFYLEPNTNAPGLVVTPELDSGGQ